MKTSGEMSVQISNTNGFYDVVVKYFEMLADMYFYLEGQHISTMEAIKPAIELLYDHIEINSECKNFKIKHSGEDNHVRVEFFLNESQIGYVDINKM